MVFNSATFIFLLFPLTLILYKIAPGRWAKNATLVILSLLFYAFGGLAQLPVLLLSILWTYIFGLLIGSEGKLRKIGLVAGVVGNLAVLCTYKYLAFVLDVLHLPALPTALPLPLGISFFTFHAISYLVDCYKENTLVEKNLGRLTLYIAFFPRLIAGPIAKWKKSKAQITERTESVAATSNGIRRFVLGLAKKLLLAESAAVVANAVYGLDPANVGTGLAWLGGLCYCLQIYYDFSGYSDMAIGLGQMFGFSFPENFDHPYVSASVSEFWRRWHMSLNRWFVDYLYIPLGGSRGGKWKTMRNRMIVFIATGIWHGTGLTFILWGLWNGILVVLESAFPKVFDAKSAPKKILLHVYSILMFLTGFMMFRAGTVSQGFALIGSLFTFKASAVDSLVAVLPALTNARVLLLVCGVVFATPIMKKLMEAIERKFGAESAALELTKNAVAMVGFVICVLAMAGGAYTPFIYQQF